MSSYFRTFLIALLITLAMAVVLYSLGRITTCECGTVKIWHAFTKSSQNSQHLFDPYSLTHVAHGIAFYFILWGLFKRANLVQKFLVAYSVEALWEIIENTNAVISRYRTATISFEYFGDSIINSVGDLFAMMLGFVIAAHAPLLFTVALFAIVEGVLLFAIKDSFMLNIIMLIKPLKFIKEWQNT